MYSQELQAINLKMEKIEHQYPNSYLKNKRWNTLHKQREIVTLKVIKKDLNNQKKKLNNLTGQQKSECEKLIRQYETYLKNHSMGVDNGID